MRLVIAAIALSACDFSPSSVETPPDASHDALPEVSLDAAACNPLGFVPSNFDPCALPDSVGSLTDLEIVSIDTLNSTIGEDPVPSIVIVQPNGPEAMLVLADNIALGIVEVRGPRALILVSLGDIHLSDFLFLGNHSAETHCTPAVDGETQSSGGGNFAGSGGGGGGFGGVGGTGAPVEGSMEPPTLAGAAVISSLSPLVGGCSGGDGGDGLNTGGPGGRGGGAVQLVARNSLEISPAGFVWAFGEGGDAPSGPNSGGGGGGSGGSILLEAPLITVEGSLSANGGGGGEGRRGTDPGADGQRGGTSASPAAGGSGNPNGGDGGDGGAGTVAATNGTQGTSNANNAAGGGGGGGAVGRIRMRANTFAVSGVVTPPADQVSLD